MVATSFTDQEIYTLVILERTGGTLSLFAVTLIFIFYGAFKRLRTVPNTFLVFASIANVGASVAGVIAYSGVWQGPPSTLCQAQGFLFEMFVQSDPWWSLSMAINVFMVFFMGASPQTFKKWGWVYCIICYGGPLLIAVVCLELRDPSKGLVYGNAGLWCWISNDWNPLRIYSYYMLIWICILASGIIYICVGYHVFRSRNQVRRFMGSNQYGTSTSISANVTRSQTKPERGGNWPLSGHSHHPSLQGTVEVVTEVRITSTSSDSPPDSASSVAKPDRTFVGFRQHPTTGSDEDSEPNDRFPQPANSRTVHHLHPHHQSKHRSGPRGNVPPGIQTTVTSPPRPISSRGRKPSVAHTFLSRFMVLDPIKRAYLRTSFLFAISVLVTWIPSSMNRIRGLIYSDSPYPFNVATAVVLPLQGVWNAVIFFVTSWDVVKSCVADAAGSWRRARERKRRRDERGVVELRERMVEYDDVWARPADAPKQARLQKVDTEAEKRRRVRDEKAREEESQERESWDFADIGLERSDGEDAREGGRAI